MENEESPVLLKVEHLCQYFKSEGVELKAVDNVSFDIREGEVFGLVGESGSGKTTTARSIIRLYKITSGNVFFKGVRIGAGAKSYIENIRALRSEYRKAKRCLTRLLSSSQITKETYKDELHKLKRELKGNIAKNKANLREAKNDQKSCNKISGRKAQNKIVAEYKGKLASAASEADLKLLKKQYRQKLRDAKRTRFTTQIQMIFQDPVESLDPRMTIREIISEGLIIKGVRDRAYLDTRMYEMLDLVGLRREYADRYPHELSGGQRQRIGIARAVVMGPDLIIADEPVSALDVSIRAQVINLLNDLRRSMRLTILFIAHDLSVVKYFSDRIGVMYSGHLVEIASSDELFLHPLHPYTRSLLSAIPLPDPVCEKTRKRVIYNPHNAHNYTHDKPSFREVCKGHFVMCNNEEFQRYLLEIK